MSSGVLQAVTLACGLSGSTHVQHARNPQKSWSAGGRGKGCAYLELDISGTSIQRKTLSLTVTQMRTKKLREMSNIRVVSV